jgi:folate-dependent phosphoribosylglycinamide formyltransferase PurN
MATAARRPRISVVTNGNYFSTLALRPLLAATVSHWDWQIITTTGLRRQSGNRASEALQLLARWGGRYTAYKVSTYVLPWLLQTLTRRPFLLNHACHNLGLPIVHARNVNQPQTVSAIHAFAPDILVSFSCPYRIRAELLKLPTIGCLNAHSSLLPAYAGIGTYMHVLARGEPATGMTIHEMIEEFDAGRIVAQEPIPITSGMSVFELFSQQCTVGGRLLRDALNLCLRERRIVGRPQDHAQRTYLGEPGRHEVAELRRRGFRLFAPADLARMWNVQR